MHILRTILAILLLFIVTGFQSAGADLPPDDFQPRDKPYLLVTRTSGEIDVDGQLHEAAWRTAAVADNFSEHYPGDRTKPRVQTRAYVTYDENNLYVAFVCSDEPDEIRATYCDRDHVDADDFVQLGIDPYGTAQLAYLLCVNPYGIQGDAILYLNGQEDRSYDMIWESAALVTDSGYQVELAVPFSSLRFPRKSEQNWRIDFNREHPRAARAGYSWAARDRNEICLPCQWGTLSGISDVQPGRGIEIAPSLLAFQSGELDGAGQAGSPYEFDNHDLDGEPSLWAKYTISSNTTVETTVNPDFSQIESDAGQVDVNTTFALYYPERRPFFQEGYDLFRASTYSVYTRSINDPEFAVKVIRRGDRTSFAYLLARDRNAPYILPSSESSDLVKAGKATSNIFRIKHNVADGSYIGLIATDQRFDRGGGAITVNQDARLRLTPSLRAVYHVGLSHTHEFEDSSLTADIANPDGMIDSDHTRAFDGESFYGYFILGSLSRRTSTWFTGAMYQESDHTFRQPNGLFRQVGYRYIGTSTSRFFRFPSGTFETVRLHLDLESEWKYFGGLNYRLALLNVLTRLRFAQASFNSSLALRQEDFAGKRFDDIWYVHQDGSLQLNDRIALFGSATYGHQVARRFATMGKNLDLSLEASFKLSDRVLINQNIDFARSDDLDSGLELYEGYIIRTRFDYQVSRPLSLRLIVEYNDFVEQLAVDPLLTYRVNAFSVLYLGMTSSYRSLPEETVEGHISQSNRLTSRQFFAKLQYLFQI